MDNMDKIKTLFLSATGFTSGAIIKLLGGWDVSISVLIFFIVTDYLMGLCLAGVFHKSPKTETGALSSDAGFKGIAKKLVMLVMVAVATKLDALIGTDFIRTGVIFAFCANEVLSIAENAGLMLGYPVPDVIKNAIDVLSKKGSGGK